MSALGTNINYSLLHIQVDATLYNYYLLVLRFFNLKVKNIVLLFFTIIGNIYYIIIFTYIHFTIFYSIGLLFSNYNFKYGNF